MKNLMSAWRFVQALREGHGPAPAPWEGPAGLRGSVVHPHGAPRGVVLAIHGMSPRAETDVRWTRALSALGAAGFTVISPRFRSIAALRIGPEQIDEIAIAAAELAAADREQRGVSLFSVSFSAGLAAAAAARPIARSAVKAVCAIGGWARLGSLLPTVLGDSLPDPYARFVILENFIEASLGRPMPQVREALRAAAEANFHERPFDLEAAMGRALASLALPGELASEVLALTLGRGDAEDFARRLCDHEPRLFPSIEPLGQLGGLSAAVTLVHGVCDPVIPAEQSRALAARLAETPTPPDGRSRPRARLLVTPLIGHGDTRLPLRALLREGPALLSTFAGFFRSAAERPRGRVKMLA
jgi:pimeloyl-ACP methyl ester carboxylesterase